MSAYPKEDSELYSTEEVQQILQLAIARQASRGELSLTQVKEIASELSIDSQSLQLAIGEWQEKKTIQHKQQAFNLYRRQILKNKVVRFMIVNSFLCCLNLLSAGSLTWSVYVAIIWGLRLSLDSWNTYNQSGEIYEQAFKNWLLKQEIKNSVASIWQKLKKAWL